MALKDEKSAGVLIKEKSINKDQNIPTVKNYINGKWVSSIGTETVDVINPANKKIISRFKKDCTKFYAVFRMLNGIFHGYLADTPTPRIC